LSGIKNNKQRFNRRNTIAGLNEEDGHIGPSSYVIKMKRNRRDGPCVAILLICIRQIFQPGNKYSHENPSISHHGMSIEKWQ